MLRACVEERRRAPGEDGLSRILAAAASSGTALSDEEATLEAHHIVIAGCIVYAELGAMVQQLTSHPEVRERLTAEIAEKAPSGPIALEQLAMAMPYLNQVVSEVKRLAVPSHVEHGVYTDPQRFDPDRFSPERAEDKRHEHAFVPQGAGPAMGHRCPGLDFATYVMAIFGIVLLRGYTWELPPQSFAIDWSKTPPDVVDGLRAKVRAR